MRWVTCKQSEHHSQLKVEFKVEMLKLVYRDAQMIMEDIKRAISELEQESSLPAVGVELVDNELATLYMNSKKSEVNTFNTAQRRMITHSKVTDRWSRGLTLCLLFCSFPSLLSLCAGGFQGLPSSAPTGCVNSQEDPGSPDRVRSGLQQRWWYPLPQTAPATGETLNKWWIHLSICWLLYIVKAQLLKT